MLWPYPEVPLDAQEEFCSQEAAVGLTAEVVGGHSTVSEGVVGVSQGGGCGEKEGTEHRLELLHPDHSGRQGVSNLGEVVEGIGHSPLRGDEVQPLRRHLEVGWVGGDLGASGCDEGEHLVKEDHPDVVIGVEAERV